MDYSFKKKKNKVCIKCSSPCKLGYRYCSSCEQQIRASKLFRTKELREERKKLGICIDCKKEPAQVGRVRCTSCLDKVRTYNISLFNSRREQGVCVVCKTPSSTRYCTSCKGTYKVYSARHNLRWLGADPDEILPLPAVQHHKNCLKKKGLKIND
jgi:hypothetical protein